MKCKLLVNPFASLAKWLSVRLPTKWLWVQVPLQESYCVLRHLLFKIIRLLTPNLFACVENTLPFFKVFILGSIIVKIQYFVIVARLEYRIKKINVVYISFAFDFFSENFVLQSLMIFVTAFENFFFVFRIF